MQSPLRTIISCCLPCTTMYFVSVSVWRSQRFLQKWIKWWRQQSVVKRPCFRIVEYINKSPNVYDLGLKLAQRRNVRRGEVRQFSMQTILQTWRFVFYCIVLHFLRGKNQDSFPFASVYLKQGHTQARWLTKQPRIHFSI